MPWATAALLDTTAHKPLFSLPTPLTAEIRPTTIMTQRKPYSTAEVPRVSLASFFRNLCLVMNIPQFEP